MSESIPSETSESDSQKLNYVSRDQASRIEAKLDDLQGTMKQIQRMIISLSNSTVTLSNSENLIPKLPLTTEESLCKFEADLDDNMFRQSVVSNILFIIT